MNRFAALDIEEYDEPPDIVEQERELAENVREAEKAGLGPKLDDLKKLIVLQRTGGSFFRTSGLIAQYVISQGSSMRTDHIWLCKNGETLFVSNMSDTHLLNSARLLMRKREETSVRFSLENAVRFSLDVLRHEANRRGRLL